MRWLCLVVVCVVSWLWAGCGESEEVGESCVTSRECEAGMWCFRGRCVSSRGGGVRSSGGATSPVMTPSVSGGGGEEPWVDGTEGPSLGFDASGGSSGGVGGGGDAPCGGGVPLAGELMLHEVLVNVPSGVAGDANGDGVRDAYGDEFVELVNVGERVIDLSGVEILNGDRARHTFGSLCLGPAEAVVVFGGDPGPGPWDEGVVALRSQVRFAFSNSSGAVGVRRGDGVMLARLVYESSPGQSLALWPEWVGEVMVPHDRLAQGVLFSPGRCADGRPLKTRCEDLLVVVVEGDAED